MASRFPSPTIDSFSSYSKVRNFRFHGLDRSLFLVSSSTSGDLVRQLIAVHRAHPTRVITLFYAGEQDTEGVTLCNLLSDESHTGGLVKDIVSYSEDNCALCQRGSVSIRIFGDQFIPENPRISVITINKHQSPNWLGPFMKNFVGKKVIGCHWVKGTRGLNRELFFNMESVYLRGSKRLRSDFAAYAARFDQVLTQCIPASLCRIIHLDDPGSRALAKMIKRGYQGYTGLSSGVQLQSAREVSKSIPQHELNEGTTLVAAGCIATGRALMAVSQ